MENLITVKTSFGVFNCEPHFLKKEVQEKLLNDELKLRNWYLKAYYLSIILLLFQLIYLIILTSNLAHSNSYSGLITSLSILIILLVITFYAKIKVTSKEFCYTFLSMIFEEINGSKMDK